MPNATAAIRTAQFHVRVQRLVRRLFGASPPNQRHLALLFGLKLGGPPIYADARELVRDTKAQVNAVKLAGRETRIDVARELRAKRSLRRLPPF